MTKEIFSVLILTACFFSPLPAFGQIDCQTPAVTNPSNEKLYRQSLKKPNTTTNESYFLRVFFHVLRKSNGTGGQSYANVLRSFQILNADFNPYRIYFVWNDSIDYIDDTDKYYYPSANIFQQNNHINGIDIYLYPDDVVRSSGGMANGVGMSSEFYVAGKPKKAPELSYITSHVISHEMGHVLNLWHTHHGTFNEGGNDNPCAELVDGTNSDVCGDYIMDTPADPNLRQNVDPTTFQWLSSGVDANGDSYQPDTRQIMSYSDVRCMSHFSSGQGERMRNSIESLQYLQNVLVPYIIGETVPCGMELYSIDSMPAGASVTWSWKRPSDIAIYQLMPGSNECTINNTNKSYIKNTLVATISKDGVAIATVEKAIDTGINFFGTYEQAASPAYEWNLPGTPPTAFHSGSKILLLKGSTITLHSSCFIGASITYTGSGPSTWTHSGSTITMKFNYLPPASPLSINSIPAARPSTITITGVYANSCETFQFIVSALPHPTPLIDASQLSLGINNTWKDFTFQLTARPLSSSTENAEGIINEGSNNNEVEEFILSGWQLTIVNTQTGKVVFDQIVDGEAQTINAARWEPGIYVVRATFGEAQVSQKLIIGN